MKNFLITLVLLFLFQTNLFSQENVISFKLVHKNESDSTYVLTDRNLGKLFVEQKDILNETDISDANVIVDREKPPWFIESAAKNSGASMIYPQIYINIVFNGNGKRKLSQFTSENIGRRVAIIINSELIMAPRIMEKIDSGEIKINTGYTEEEANLIVAQIKSNISK
ncbi:hypothetical protein [uncultured Desulfosarcina sp.]|uniref:SecDF P1 head subdomain-containing protein n=1 Tax=uncultured Desulfosarcina sp. TaxID=218289 RepID=UPI0029C617EA|nr:hypothetical protein [uncultured Desulfosarcina sp.]